MQSGNYIHHGMRIRRSECRAVAHDDHDGYVLDLHGREYTGKRRDVSNSLVNTSKPPKRRLFLVTCVD